MVVTPAQLTAGWLTLEGVDVTQYPYRLGDTKRRPFEVIRQLEDGNYVVRNPELTVLEEERA